MKLQGQNYWLLDPVQVNFILICIVPYVVITVNHINQQMPVTVRQILYQLKKKLLHVRGVSNAKEYKNQYFNLASIVMY